MMRLTLILLSSAALVACGTHGHKIPVNRTLKGQEHGAGDNELAKKLSQFGKDSAGKEVKECLNLPNITAVLAADAKKLYTTYTSDMDLGTITNLGNGCPQFTSSQDKLARAATYFQKSSPIKPALSLWTAPDLVGGASDVGAVVGFSGQDTCKNATFNHPLDGASGPTFDIVCKSPRMIGLKDPKANTYIVYALDNNSLSITYYKEINLPTNCPGLNSGVAVSKVTNVITWNGANDDLRIKGTFAEILHDYVTLAPDELSTKVLPRNSAGGKGKTKSVLADSVNLSWDTYSYVVEQIDQAKTKDLKCQ